MIRQPVLQAALALCFALPRFALAQDANEYTVRGTRIASPVEIDGEFKEPFWAELTPITTFVAREPVEGQPISERTEVRVAYDDDNLYFGFTLYDSDPAGIVRSVLQREGPSQNDDHIMIGLDTFLDRRNAYIFGLNPFGTQEDAIVTDEGQPNWNWEGVYASQARITAEGWTLEVAIPFATIRIPNKSNPVMGIAFYRQIRRKNEEATWPPIGRNYGSKFFQVSQYGELTDLADIRGGHHLQMKPYTLATGHDSNADSVSLSTTHDVGFDVRYAVTSDATLDLTYNTDFAQVEADNAQLNLTRFSVFFPEKRDFFLETNGLFAFGVPANQGFRQPLEAATFFSRRIGLNQPILGGVRYSGRTGPLAVGVMNIQTETKGAFEGQNFGVARVRAALAPSVIVGGIATNVHGGDNENTAAGADVDLRFWRSSFVKGWVSHVWDDRYSGATTAASASLLLRNDRYSYQLDYLDVGEHFAPAVGYVRRTDMVRYTSDAGFNPRPRIGSLSQLHFNAGGFLIYGHDGETQSSQGYLKASATFQSGDDLGVTVNRERDVPTDPFSIADAVIPAGDYVYRNVELRANSSQARRYSGQISWDRGEYYGGTKTSFSGQVSAKPVAQIQIGYNFERDQLDLPVAAGRFTTQLHGLDLFLAKGRDLYSNSLIQYDNISRRLQANVRVRWTYRPGSDLYLVYNTTRTRLPDVDVGRRVDTNAALAVKLSYLLAL